MSRRNLLDTTKENDPIEDGCENTGEAPRSSDICGKKFRDKGHLREQVAIHTEVQHHKCDVCGKDFNQKGDLRKHAMIHIEQKPYSCEICGVESQKQSNGSPSDTHRKCEICGKEFCWRSNFRRHQITHDEVKSCKCDICGKKLSLKDTFLAHLRIHTGEKPFKLRERV
ncbi:zinc finger protein 92-like [Ylistrum balloti]|uniref:zinc finger protein 92-like n=1 Tax=Ylistrum balloti TaxID=509963 RepID=UPI002905D7E4|nr:zinc finger protein 92-like [Ylistrum balloti]